MRIHFIGIGGIGISALAKYYLAKGVQVSGSDLEDSEIIQSLKDLGAKIFIGPQKPENLPSNLDLVIYSLAIPENNPELKKAIQQDIAVKSYPQALGELTKKYFTIAIAGTHGKSTTGAMVAHILIEGGLDPTVILGTKLKKLGNSNCRVGESKFLVIEADEYREAFLNYWPKIMAITNIEEEHLDFYKNLGNILKAYRSFISHLPPEGKVIINQEDPNSLNVSKEFKEKVIYFSMDQPEAEKIRSALSIPGEYNVYNGLAAFKIAQALDIPSSTIIKALSEYPGAWRRFDLSKLRLEGKDLIIINDYAHHPTEIKAVLKAARKKYPSRKIWAIFQPHQYQRTFYLFDDLVQVFKQTLDSGDLELNIDKLIITDIYKVPGREKKSGKQKVSSKQLVEEIKDSRAIHLSSLKKTEDFLSKNLTGGEVVIIMGAGNIYKLEQALKERLPE